MEDLETNNKSTQTKIFYKQKNKSMNDTQSNKEMGYKPICFPFNMICATCRVMNINWNATAQFNLDGHHDTFNSSSLYILYTESKKVELKHCLHFAFCHIITA